MSLVTRVANVAALRAIALSRCPLACHHPDPLSWHISSVRPLASETLNIQREGQQPFINRRLLRDAALVGLSRCRAAGADSREDRIHQLIGYVSQIRARDVGTNQEQRLDGELYMSWRIRVHLLAPAKPCRPFIVAIVSITHTSVAFELS